MTPVYCTQNQGKCETCSLVNYYRDCRNISIDENRSKENSGCARLASAPFVRAGRVKVALR